MASKRPVHFIVKGRPACGVTPWAFGSTDFRCTTCDRCTRTLAMADAEAKAQLQPNRVQ